jgi:hypothetical protein
MGGRAPVYECVLVRLWCALELDLGSPRAHRLRLRWTTETAPTQECMAACQQHGAHHTAELYRRTQFQLHQRARARGRGGGGGGGQVSESATASQSMATPCSQLACRDLPFLRARCLRSPRLRPGFFLSEGFIGCLQRRARRFVPSPPSSSSSRASYPIGERKLCAAVRASMVH